MPLHPQGLKPCTLNETESIAPVYSNSKTSCHKSCHIIIKVKWFIIIKIQITCEQVSSKNKFFQCARAGCYIKYVELVTTILNGFLPIRTHLSKEFVQEGSYPSLTSYEQVTLKRNLD
jgi:hypothetical protein